MQHKWIVERSETEDLTNIIWGFVFIEWNKTFNFGWFYFDYDGLPMRRIELGPIAIGWGQNHEWFISE